MNKKNQPVTKRNKPATKIDRQLLAQDVAETPDAFLYERAERFCVTATGIAHALKRLRISYKKTFRHPKADDSARVRFQAKILAHKTAGNPMVYIDKSGFSQDMPRCRGGSRKGQRCYGRHD